MTVGYPLGELRELGVVERLGEQLALALCGIAEVATGTAQPQEVGLAIALLSRHVGQGHVCMDLEALCRRPPRLPLPGAVRPLPLPPLSALRETLVESPLVDTGRGTDGGNAPLVLAGTRLYLRRYFEHEQRLGQDLRARSQRQHAVDAGWLRAALQRLFPDDVIEPAAAGGSDRPAGGRRQARARVPAAAAAKAPPQLSLDFDASPAVDSGAPGGDGNAVRSPATEDLQRVACERALQRGFFVVSGGPGTGKTSTVVKLLALVVEHALSLGQPAPRMQLLAPTGKAAARLSESIGGARDRLDIPDGVRRAIPSVASTIHRALGTGRRGFTHDRQSPLVTDFVLVDEASMVDLALMRRLFDAIPSHARVVLLGDRNQLASVEAGAVLGDICGAGLPMARRRAGTMARSVVHLTRSYRYRDDSGIGLLADAIQSGDGSEVLRLLRGGQHTDIVLHEGALTEGLSPALQRGVLEGYAPYLRAEDPAAQLTAFDGFRVLCAHRRGPHGVEQLGRRIAELLRNRGLISGGSAVEGPHGQYAGRPIIVTQNDYQSRLFNGDVGVLAREPQSAGGEAAEDGPVDAALRCYFPVPGAAPRSVAPSRLPPHEGVFAMSIHKSQGSEFDEVAIVLPQAGSALLSRELLYTAVTRARRRVVIHAPAEVVAEAVGGEVARASGLRELLWDGPAAPS